MVAESSRRFHHHIYYTILMTLKAPDGAGHMYQKNEDIDNKVLGHCVAVIAVTESLLGANVASVS